MLLESRRLYIRSLKWEMSDLNTITELFLAACDSFAEGCDVTELEISNIPHGTQIDLQAQGPVTGN